MRPLLLSALLLLFITCICTPFFSKVPVVLSEKWAVEFADDDENQATNFASTFGLVNLGRIGSLNAFEFELKEDLESSTTSNRRDIVGVKAMLSRMQTENNRDSPTHPIADLEYLSQLINLNSYNSRRSSSSVSNQATISQLFRVTWIQKQEEHSFEKRSLLTSNDVVITDPLYIKQYHLKKLEFPAVSLNVTGAWSMGIDGTGVTIGIVDDGLQHVHPDIRPNYVSAGSYNFDHSSPDPSPKNNYADYHGTSSAGVAAARDDGQMCGVGVSYRAGLSGIVILQNDVLNDGKEARALQYQLGINHIYSNSWGPPDGGSVFAGPGPLTKQAIDIGIRSGRNQKGAIYVWAGGNGGARDNCNYDGYANLRTAITVGAVDYLGVKSSFSEECAALLVVAPSASNDRSFIRTTDLLGASGRSNGDCNEAFSGTSAACPAVAGVVALILQANPALSWLDVQRVLIETAYHNDPNSNTWKVNGAGIPYSHNYGFGLADASKAVARAKDLASLPSMNSEVLLSYQSSEPLEYKANNPDLSNSNGIYYTIPVEENAIIHHVELIIEDLRCPDSGKLDISITSPQGTVSVLSKSHQVNPANLKNWRFTARYHWGETSAGNWIIKIIDTTANTPRGSLMSHALRIYATPNSAVPSNSIKVKSGDTYISVGSPAPPRFPTSPSQPFSPIPSAPYHIPTWSPTSPTESPSVLFKHRLVQVGIIVGSVIAGSILISLAIIGMIWYWKTHRGYSYGALGEAEIEPHFQSAEDESNEQTAGSDLETLDEDESETLQSLDS